MSRLLAVRFGLSCVLLMMVGRQALAQVAMPRAQGPGTLSGVVVDADAAGRKICTHVVWLRK